MIADPICDLIGANATIVAKVAKYNGVPAIFDFTPAPPNCPQPLITVEEDGGPWTGTRDTHGMRMRATINIWGNKTYSRALLRDIATLTWETIDRQHLTLTGLYCERGCWAHTPREMTDRDGFPGYTIPVDVLVHKD